ncbi:hypothetical protein VTK56DRAFT_1683 [Thermocarpiscus australiensis]
MDVWLPRAYTVPYRCGPILTLLRMPVYRGGASCLLRKKKLPTDPNKVQTIASFRSNAYPIRTLTLLERSAKLSGRTGFGGYAGLMPVE